MKLYKVMYSLCGKHDYTWELGTDELDAQALVLRRYPTASITRCILFPRGIPSESTSLCPVIYVDFALKRRKAG